MIRPHPLTAMSEREWSTAWSGEQREVDRLDARRGSWLPNIVERRGWGLVRWTSGRPSHAATSGQAVTETFVVLRPDVDGSTAAHQITEALREDPPVVRILGVGARRHQLLGGIPAAVGLAIVAGVVAGLLGAGVLVILLAAVVGAIVGGFAGAAAAQYVIERRRATVLGDNRRLRVVTGRFAPRSWLRLVEAATALEATLPADGSPIGEADRQAAEAVRAAMWEAAGLLLTSSDHTGVEILADGVSRLAQAHRT